MSERMDRYKVLAVRKPGQKGTKKLVEKYGSRLRCVRYLYDRVSGLRVKTLELVQEANHRTSSAPHPDEVVGIRVGHHEVELMEKIKKWGGRWNRYDKLWILRCKDIERLGLETREISIREEPAHYAA